MAHSTKADNVAAALECYASDTEKQIRKLQRIQSKLLQEEQALIAAMAESSESHDGVDAARTGSVN